MPEQKNYQEPIQVQLVTPPSSLMAYISLLAGLATWFVLPVIGAIVAIITGHIAKRKIRKSDGYILGEGLAKTGLILGYLHIALVVIGICLILAILTSDANNPAL